MRCIATSGWYEVMIIDSFDSVVCNRRRENNFLVNALCPVNIIGFVNDIGLVNVTCLTKDPNIFHTYIRPTLHM